MSKKTIALLLTVIFGAYGLFIGGCAKQEKRLIVYSGTSLTRPMEEIKVAFESRDDI